MRLPHSAAGAECELHVRLLLQQTRLSRRFRSSLAARAWFQADVTCATGEPGKWSLHQRSSSMSIGSRHGTLGRPPGHPAVTFSSMIGLLLEAENFNRDDRDGLVAQHPLVDFDLSGDVRRAAPSPAARDPAPRSPAAGASAASTASISGLSTVAGAT